MHIASFLYDKDIVLQYLLVLSLYVGDDSKLLPHQIWGFFKICPVVQVIFSLKMIYLRLSDQGWEGRNHF